MKFKFLSIHIAAFPFKEVSDHSSAIFNVQGNQTTDNIAIIDKFCECFPCVARKRKCSKNTIMDHVWGKPGVTEIGRNESVCFEFKHVNEKEVYDESKNLKKRKHIA